ncbi:hypothetical protein R3P38DRAFT_3210637 [Favolaschia claudopus]|uniref:Uncharacterized protein n=1 Tax=Favolaschia claudopus TaxID=2862362 RepID=A0AAW0AGF6_9AGAR
MSINSLSAFANRCPRLDGQALTIFDTRDVPLVVDSTLNSQLPLVRLDVGVSQLQPEDILKVTDFLTIVPQSNRRLRTRRRFEDLGEENLPAYLANPEAYRRFQGMQWGTPRDGPLFLSPPLYHNHPQRVSIPILHARILPPRPPPIGCTIDGGIISLAMEGSCCIQVSASYSTAFNCVLPPSHHQHDDPAPLPLPLPRTLRKRRHL